MCAGDSDTMQKVLRIIGMKQPTEVVRVKVCLANSESRDIGRVEIDDILLHGDRVKLIR